MPTEEGKCTLILFCPCFIHQHDKFNLDVVESVIHNKLDVLSQFPQTLRPRLGDPSAWFPINVSDTISR